MARSLRLAYLAHAVRSDWNNGNAHYLRGLLRAMTALGHRVEVLEPASEWSIDNLRKEPLGQRSLDAFHSVYSDLTITSYAAGEDLPQWRERLRNIDIVILHEWNPAALARLLLELRDELHFKLLFHDTHHRASSSPEQIERFGVARFDGVLAFGDALRNIYRERFLLDRVWTLHEAADTTVFFPRASMDKQVDGKHDTVVWIGNWGDGERAEEICEFLLRPAAHLAPAKRFTVYGVRYPPEGLDALRHAHVCYGGYLPNLDAPAAYAAASLTVHIPRRQYAAAMRGIPTIRVFEALASGIPLLSAPWDDSEKLFRPGDFMVAQDTDEMTGAMEALLRDPGAAARQAAHGLETVLARHTCGHRAEQLTHICEELLQ